MSDRFITNEEARALLKARCATHGSILALAKEINAPPCTISLMRSGKRLVSKGVGRALGLKAVRGFVQSRRGGANVEGDAD
jgi:hypothetical protein